MDFVDQLDAWLEGRLPASERAAIERHLSQCGECRDLQRALTTAQRERPPSDLVSAIIAHTSGSTCHSARERLGDHVDGRLDPVDDELVAAHVGSCADCAALRRVLVRLAVELPRLAELRPDARFVDDVLVRTLPRRRRAAPLVGRWRSAWQRLLARPRLAWEGAYVGTFVLFLVFGAPGAPLAGVPQRALELAGGQRLADLQRPVAGVEVRVVGGARSAWGVARETLITPARSTAHEASRRTSDRLDTWKAEAGTLWDEISSWFSTQDDDVAGVDEATRGDSR